MTDAPSAFDPSAWLRAWTAPFSATNGGFSQPILPGWQFGGVIVNEQNSSNPVVERRIVAQESYGRQIGRLMDAVWALVERQGGAGEVEAFKALAELRKHVEELKADAAQDHLTQISQDLAYLKDNKPAAYDSLVADLKALLP